MGEVTSPPTTYIYYSSISRDFESSQRAVLGSCGTTLNSSPGLPFASRLSSVPIYIDYVDANFASRLLGLKKSLDLPSTQLPKEMNTDQYGLLPLSIHRTITGWRSTCCAPWWPKYHPSNLSKKRLNGFWLVASESFSSWIFGPKSLGRTSWWLESVVESWSHHGWPGSNSTVGILGPAAKYQRLTPFPQAKPHPQSNSIMSLGRSFQNEPLKFTSWGVRESLRTLALFLCQ